MTQASLVQDLWLGFGTRLRARRLAPWEEPAEGRLLFQLDPMQSLEQAPVARAAGEPGGAPRGGRLGAEADRGRPSARVARRYAAAGRGRSARLRRAAGAARRFRSRRLAGARGLAGPGSAWAGRALARAGRRRPDRTATVGAAQRARRRAGRPRRQPCRACSPRLASARPPRPASSPSGCHACPRPLTSWRLEPTTSCWHRPGRRVVAAWAQAAARP